MDFVWIYAHPFSYYAKSGLWNEIEYSIKSVRQYYPGAVCWVVGDDPGFDVRHIPSNRIETHQSNVPIDMDVIKKFRAIFDSEIGDDFILMYDDIFLLQPLTREDFDITYGRCKVEDVETYQRPWSRSYRMLWQKTYRVIKEITDEVYDWETHLPRLYNKGKLKQVLDAYCCDTIPYIATSLYAAQFATDTVIIDSSVQLNLLNSQQIEYDFSSKFLNIMDESITVEFKEKMREVFGESTCIKSAHRRH